MSSDGDSLEVLNAMSGGDNLAVEQVTRPNGTVVLVPVSKIRLGDAGEDLGSVSDANPMPVEDGRRRRLDELSSLREQYAARADLTHRHFERSTFGDRMSAAAFRFGGR